MAMNVEIDPSAVPTPTGWRVVVRPIDIPKESEGGIILPNGEVKSREYLRFIGKVVAMGPLCFTQERFSESSGRDPKPWCKVGDMVAHLPYAGMEMRVMSEGKELLLRLINDDEVIAVINNPDAVVV